MAYIQFIKGINEKVLPDIRLTRSRDGTTGTATFRFKNANILDKSLALNGEITGMYMIDKEGILETRDVSACFVNGKPQAVESIYIMKSPEDWSRFMRFMEQYRKSNSLIFTKA
jgi:photosystem II protein